MLFSIMFSASFALAENSSAIAARNRQYSQTQQKDKSKEKECTYTSKCGCSKYQTCCAMLPLPVNRNGHVFAEGEYLYWKTYALFPYIAKRVNVTPFDLPSIGSLFDTDIKSVELEADSGYRVTLGFYLSECWSLRTVFRQYNADGSDSFRTASLERSSEPLGERIDVLWGTMEDLGGSDDSWRVSSRQRYREKVWDIDFARAFSCYRFTLNSFMGVRFAWVKSDSNIKLNKIVTATGEIESNLPLKNDTDINNRFNLGVGLHMGVDAQMDLPWGFGFYSHSQVAALIGQFKYRQKTDAISREALIVPPEFGTTVQTQKVTDFQTNLSLGTGLNWGHHFSNCGYYLGFKLGYEVNIWPNFISAFRSVVEGSKSVQTTWRKSVLTHGLTLSARFDF